MITAISSLAQVQLGPEHAVEIDARLSQRGILCGHPLTGLVLLSNLASSGVGPQARDPLLFSHARSGRHPVVWPGCAYPW